MADQFLLNYKQSLSLADIDPNNEFLIHFSGLNPSHHQDISTSIMGFPHDNMILPLETLPGLFIQDDNTQPIILNENDHKDRKRKAFMDIISTPESSSAYSSPQASANGSRKTNRGGRGKKMRGNEKEDEKPREVIHVRAKRGQATDSHSLAERVRRGKINERLRCLQDIVPGCYKTMGMAVMLDEIINYVRSLQNQVEFLSMKLTAAASSYDFNSDTDVMDCAMQRAKAFEALKVQNIIVGKQQQQGLPSAHHFSPLPLHFGHTT